MRRTSTVDREIFTSKNFRLLLKWQKLIERKFFHGWQLVYACMCTCANSVEASYTGFYLKWWWCHIANSSQVKLAVISNTAQSWNFTCVNSNYAPEKFFTTMPDGENQKRRNLKHGNFPTQKFPNLQYVRIFICLHYLARDEVCWGGNLPQSTFIICLVCW